MGLEGIKNFAGINDRLATAGQPTRAQLGEVAKAGFDVVVNLGLAGQTYSLPDEAGLVASLGLSYHHIPVAFDAPSVEDVRQFVDVMDACAAAGRRVFVHCAANYRVASFVALYGQARRGWTAEQADACAARFWQLNDTWQGLIARVRAEWGLAVGGGLGGGGAGGGGAGGG
jgi:protein tyrosine phosphatase (PTP) superfamily phosphohydrolase (DUF442 family)